MKYLVGILFAGLLATGAARADMNTVSQALASPDRPDADKAMDAKRRPGEVLEFFGIDKPGMSVFDIFAGGGYYSEILSRIVGDDGIVTLYNNQPWDKFVAKDVEKRLADHRLPNVDRYIAAPEELIDLPDQYDAAIFVLGMHDIYYTDDENGWTTIDKQKFLKGIYNLVKPGGVLGVVDHDARPGSDPAVSGLKLHRIDPAVIIKDLESVGFKLEAQSDILKNPNDNFDMTVFDPSVRRNTDRSVLRFRK